METNDPETTEVPADEASTGQAAPAANDSAPRVQHQDLSEWRGSDLVDRDGERIGALQDVYFDVESDEPQFGTVKEGWLGRHLTFVPLIGVTVGPGSLQVTTNKEQIKSAPNIALEGDELTGEDESTLYHHYQLNYTPPDTASGRRLARR
jgi:hypothetical protein